jgi:tetratricopeptide (TPR) repeat protein
MDAIISAMAGLALFVRGNEASVIRIDDLETEATYPVSSIRYLLAGATDVKKIRGVTKKESIRLLQKEYDKGRSLNLVLILFDQSEQDETIELAVDCLHDLLSDKDVFSYIENTLYSSPFPENTNFVKAMQHTEQIPSLTSLFSDIEMHQPAISKFKTHWDELADDLFDDSTDKILYEERLVASGIFKDLVKAGGDSKLFSLIQVRCLTDLKSYKNSRTIIGNWLSGLAPGKVRRLPQGSIQYTESTNKTIGDKKGHRGKIKPHDAFLNALKQKQAIFPLLKKGDWTKTRRYVDDLISSQVENSDPEHISKSLCDLAQHAKTAKNFSLQLELTRRATEISVDDGWAYGQMADAYMCLAQFDYAIRSFQQASIYGQDEFARTGYARILREQGKFDEAITAFEGLMVDFPNSDVIANCYAEVLKDAWRIEEALSTYDSSIERFPYLSATYCGKASLLKLIGRLDESLGLYEYARKTGDDSHYIGAGIADIYRIKGEYDKAIAEYDRTIKKFPDESILKCSRANIFRLKAEYQLALDEFNSIADEFPYDVSPKEGIAETLREMNRFDESLSIFNEILSKSPMSIRARNGRANIFKCMGQYSESLQVYDQNVIDFPYDIVSWSGRADLLKQLGHLDDSIKAYERISLLNPYDKSALYSMAAIYVVKGQYEQAFHLLPTETPQTKDDWMAHHIKGMIYLKTGKIDEAIDLFNVALSKIPYYTMIRIFKNSLSVASLRKQRTSNAIESLNYKGDTSHNEYIRNVLRIHAYGESGEIDKAEAAYIQIQRDCPPYITTLRDELASRYLKQFTILGRDLNWIYEEECNIVLLAA